MIRTKKKRGLTGGAIVMLVIYGGIFLIALLMGLTEDKFRAGGQDAKEVVAVTQAEYKQYQQAQSARGSSGGGRVYVGGGYSYGK